VEIFEKQIAKMKNLIKIRKQCLKTLLQLHKTANTGHIGASLSCLDILVYLFCKRMGKEDKTILSKGHAAAALYTVLAKSGRLPEEMLETFYKDNTSLAAHPPCNGVIKDIPFGTGSLGHGLSLATGLAFSQKYTAKQYNVFCILSDGDCNEGSTWEAVLFAAQHRLNNLWVIVDYNKLQGLGYAENVLNLEPLSAKFEHFGFQTIVVDDGNNFKSLHAAFEKLEKVPSGQPKCIVAKTIKGHGVSFMENKLEWHYLPMTDEQYQQALTEIETYA
jgi:transketolase